uniref:Uncharacterized protein n=2 Tax=Timema TaxID=61471 RepID=A0A7R9HAE0_TIMPO
MNCTVLTVAHRLNTIMDSDRVIVMSNGRVEEVDHPHILLRNKEGTFFKMVDKVGPSLSRQLAMVAEKEVVVRVSYSFLMSSNRVKHRSGDWPLSLQDMNTNILEHITIL